VLFYFGLLETTYFHLQLKMLLVEGYLLGNFALYLFRGLKRLNTILLQQRDHLTFLVFIFRLLILWLVQSTGFSDLLNVDPGPLLVLLLSGVVVDGAPQVYRHLLKLLLDSKHAHFNYY
jgi:hypothetical protein